MSEEVASGASAPQAGPPEEALPINRKSELQAFLWVLRKPIYTLGGYWVAAWALLTNYYPTLALVLSGAVLAVSLLMLQRCVLKVIHRVRAVAHALAFILWICVAGLSGKYAFDIWMNL